jgi:hypothetical protein
MVAIASILKLNNADQDASAGRLREFGLPAIVKSHLTIVVLPERQVTVVGVHFHTI